VSATSGCAAAPSARHVGRKSAVVIFASVVSFCSVVAPEGSSSNASRGACVVHEEEDVADQPAADELAVDRDVLAECGVAGGVEVDELQLHLRLHRERHEDGGRAAERTRQHRRARIGSPIGESDWLNATRRCAGAASSSPRAIA
jgi:hypothetical protein